jgi:hypothetical protein
VDAMSGRDIHSKTTRRAKTKRMNATEIQDPYSNWMKRSQGQTRGCGRKSSPALENNKTKPRPNAWMQLDGEADTWKPTERSQPENRWMDNGPQVLSARSDVRLGDRAKLALRPGLLSRPGTGPTLHDPTRLDQTSDDIEQYVQGRSVFGVTRTGTGQSRMR